jgi:hypothetical protein
MKKKLMPVSLYKLWAGLFKKSTESVYIVDGRKVNERLS